jgi:hypothetical protein
MVESGSVLVPKSSNIFYCDLCDYTTFRKSQYVRHLSTDKHQKRENGSKMVVNDSDLVPKSSNSYQCECGNIYKHDSGYYRHKKKCKKTINNLHPEITAELVIEIIKQNQELQKQNSELQKQILEVCKNGTNNNNNNNNNTTNSHNKTFNLQFFLNEECKDALNISEFVSSIKIQLEDLETTGQLGYVEGVSNIINRNLNDLDQTKRPIHCSDAKREVLYIKNDDQWIKENETKPILTKAIKQIANENIKQISEWRKKYPDCTKSESRKNDQYLNIVSNAMSGITTEEQLSNYEKIISNVAKEVVIEK